MMVQENEEPLMLPPSTVPTTSRLGLPAKLFVPLPSDAQPLASRTRVMRGQPIAPGAPAPASGTLGEICDVQLLDGSSARAIELIVEESAEQPATANEPPRDLPTLLERLRSAGVCANRRTSPDLFGQLRAAIHQPVDMLVCNLLDVDGGSSLHAKVVRESGAAVISGVVALARALSVQRVFIAADP